MGGLCRRQGVAHSSGSPPAPGARRGAPLPPRLLPEPEAPGGAEGKEGADGASPGLEKKGNGKAAATPPLPLM